MKNISALASFAAFAVFAMISSIAVAAPVGPGATVESITASILVPAAQELPIHLAMN